jgi:hypothetical protein
MIKKLLGKYLSGEESILSSSFDAKRKYVSHVRSQIYMELESFMQ